MIKFYLKYNKVVNGTLNRVLINELEKCLDFSIIKDKLLGFNWSNPATTCVRVYLLSIKKIILWEDFV